MLLTMSDRHRVPIFAKHCGRAFPGEEFNGPGFNALSHIR